MADRVERNPGSAGQAGGAPRSVAVIDVGTSTVRLVVAQVDDAGNLKVLDTLQQAVQIGHDTFASGEISRGTIEECVRVLRSYRTVMAEYQVQRAEQFRVVATSAVREATNRDAFIDRVLIATGLVVEPLDEVDVIRLTYLGLYSQSVWDSALSEGQSVVAAIEGGSTDVFFMDRGKVGFSRHYRLGSVRLQRMLDTFRTPALHEQALVEDHIRQTVDAICRSLPASKDLSVLALGGEARFAAERLAPEWDRESIVRLKVSRLEKLVGRLTKQTTEEIALEYRIPFAEAETLASSLMFYLQLAQSLHVKQVLVSGRSMRNGVLMEMARQGLWVSSFGDQIFEPAREVARKYEVNLAHGEHVGTLCRTLFAALQPEHKLGPWQELLLMAAAMLHEVGHYVSERSHHKHSMYLIANSELFGLSQRDRLIVALLARYHRRTTPKPTHEGYMDLEREDQVVVVKLAAILRVADALDSSYSQRIREIRCVREPGRLVVETPGVMDLSMETMSMRGKSGMFQDVYGMEIVLRGRT
jgi:exopolyphosphatase/guanosine-5'-triphosphate,3'-diphosphate pyrophosphatase